MATNPQSASNKRAGAAADGGAAYLDPLCWNRLLSADKLRDTAVVWLGMQCSRTAGVHSGVVVLGPPGDGPFAPVSTWPAGARPTTALMQASELAMAERKNVARQSPDGDAAASYIAVPLELDGMLYGVVALECEASSDSELLYQLRDLQWGVSHLHAAALREQPGKRSRDAEQLRLVLTNLVACLETGDAAAARTVLLNRLVAEIGAARGMLGEVTEQTLRVVAISGAAQVNLKANLVQAVAAAMQEAVDQNRALRLPLHDGDDMLIHRAHDELAQAESYRAICTVPIYNEAQVTGALLFEREQPFEDEEVSLLEQVGAACGPILHLKRLNDRSLLAVSRDRSLGFLRALIGPRHAVLKAVILILSVLVAALALIDGTHRVAAPVVLEGAVERVVTAPYAGYVSGAITRPGDVLAEGDEMARLEDRDLRLDLARLLSQREQLERQYLEAIAERERAGTQIIKAQIAQTDAQIELLNERVSRSVIRAPFAGTVVSGDLSRSIGEPVERGQTLFKVAPLGDYRVALSVDERDVTFLREGQRGRLVLAPRPELDLDIEVARITPVAAAEEGLNVFRVEARLLQPAPDLRPGMTGTGKIDIGERRLLWIWTHRFTDWLRVALWRWLP
ncbi:HlyD family efflux transporter periplasmic adaptor subunit [Seongchinamella sediminis]|uniref:HlyD family efflux transporter periplasmic adaptor subunit n=1 Tax=Seongchinamella sediminis TaxID=2283635 RepID=A0A3L7E3S2_9GAMM|nr:HlyD family efflux transporter periplasmic adaptor subunit [Seongchinamella sediminis]RLQ23595.1 HlyD family efflux transporter periplasmic adaptor subunit [Seongchinamella sediminis]